MLVKWHIHILSETGSMGKLLRVGIWDFERELWAGGPHIVCYCLVLSITCDLTQKTFFFPQRKLNYHNAFFISSLNQEKYNISFLIHLSLGRGSETMVNRKQGERKRKILTQQHFLLWLSQGNAQKMCMGRKFSFL